MDNLLLNVLQCPRCGGEYKFYSMETASEIFEDSGVLTCGRCDKSVVVIKGIPIFNKFFDDRLSAMNFLYLIFKGDKSATLFLVSILHRPFESISFHELLDFLRREKADTIFKRFETPYINLKRFTLEKYKKICQFLANEPIETLLDLGCGFGCSTNPFIAGGKAKYSLGLDSNFFFLLLFQKYCQENDLQNTSFVLFDVEKLPLPFKKSSFDLVIGISFFNHFISSKSRDMLYGFFKELARITKNSGRIYLDAVPNRLHPFPGEVNMPGLLKSKRMEKAAKALLSFTPFKWFPQRLSISLLWYFYRVNSNAIRLQTESFNTFLSYISSVIPEANVNFLPLFPSDYKKILDNFTGLTIMPQNEFYKDLTLKKWKIFNFLNSCYLILYAKTNSKY